jgi:hypothetical protein
MPRSRPITRRAFAAALLVPPVAACFRKPTSESQDDDSDYFTLEVVNHHRLNVTIFNVAHGRRDRLGEVTAVSNGTFRLHLRRFFASELQLYADAVGSPESVTSEMLHLSADDVVQWTLETELARSHLTVR